MNTKQRILDTQRFVIVEDKNYKMSLAMQRLPSGVYDSYLEPRQLFKVTLANASEHYVLAESEDGAISQASCASGLSFDEQKKLEEGATAVRLPFRIRGWSSTEF